MELHGTYEYDGTYSCLVSCLVNRTNISKKN